MTDRQRRFAEEFAACGNGAKAAREAGYSSKTARSQGQRLLTNADILQYIRQLQDQAAAARIVSATQIKAFWSDTVNDPTQKTADRLKASELLARSAGLFLHVRPGAGDGTGRLAVGEISGEDVILYLPEIERIEDCQAEEGAADES